MISPQQMLDIIATEAVEAGIIFGERETSKEPEPIVYPLCLVVKEDGTLEWRD